MMNMLGATGYPQVIHNLCTCRRSLTGRMVGGLPGACAGAGNRLIVPNDSPPRPVLANSPGLASLIRYADGTEDQQTRTLTARRLPHQPPVPTAGPTWHEKIQSVRGSTRRRDGEHPARQPAAACRGSEWLTTWVLVRRVGRLLRRPLLKWRLAALMPLDAFGCSMKTEF
jgi:hypothetical protein